MRYKLTNKVLLLKQSSGLTTLVWKNQTVSKRSHLQNNRKVTTIL